MYWCCDVKKSVPLQFLIASCFSFFLFKFMVHFYLYNNGFTLIFSIMATRNIFDLSDRRVFCIQSTDRCEFFYSEHSLFHWFPHCLWQDMTLGFFFCVWKGRTDHTSLKSFFVILSLNKYKKAGQNIINFKVLILMNFNRSV